MNERRIAVYPASFDPITNGHLDLVHRAARLFDEVVVAVATNVEKSGGTFTVDERVALLRDAVQGMPNVRVDVISTLLVDYLRRVNARIVIRGLELDALEVEHNVGHILDDIRQGAELVLRPVDFHRCDGGAFQRGKQNAPE